MSTPETNPYASPKTQPSLRASNARGECSLFRMTCLAALWFVFQFLVYSSFDLLSAFVIDAGTLRFNALIAAWGTVGVLIKGRVESILIPIVAFSGLMFAALIQGSASFELLKAIGAVGASRLGNRLVTAPTTLLLIRRHSVRSAEHTNMPPIRSTLLSSFIGAVLGIIVFCVTLLPSGVWMTLGEALLLYAAIGSFGACSRNLPLASVWLILICGARFGLSIDTSVYAGVAWFSMLAGRGGAMFLHSDDRRKVSR